MKVKMPNGYQVFLDNSVSDYDARLEIVKKNVLDYNDGQWSGYFEDAWFRETSVAGRVFNQTRDILDRVATYLIMGNFEDGNILTRAHAGKIAKKEIPASNTSAPIGNLFYGGTDEAGDTAVSPTLTTAPIAQDTYDMSEADIEQEKKKARKSKKRWKNSRTYKLNRLHSTPAIQTYRVKPVKGPDGRVLKDISSNVVLQAIYVTIGGHNGLLEATDRFKAPAHTATWCYVDTDNVFKFEGTRYRVGPAIAQYAVSDMPQINDNGEYSDFTNQAGMERILCIVVPGQGRYFYDEHIEPVDASNITPV